jgi:hypothetical protein
MPAGLSARAKAACLARMLTQWRVLKTPSWRAQGSALSLSFPKTGEQRPCDDR